MSESRCCRICLRTNAKMFDYDRYQLKHCYEQVMAKTVNDKDALPHTFCYECATLLHKFHKFKEKCYKGENALKMLLKRGQLSIDSVLNSNRKRLNLQSPLEIITTNKRIKTYLVKHKTKISDLVVGSEEIKVNKIEEIVSDGGGLVSDHGDDVHSDDTPSDREELIDYGTLTDKHPDPIKEEKVEFIKDEDLEDIMTLSEVKKSIKSETKPESESEDDRACSEVFCDVEKEIEMPVKKPVSKKKKSRNEKLYQKSSKFYKKERKGLNPAYWNQFSLTEDEALKSFNARAEDSKYLAAPFKCFNCYKLFLTQETLNRHMQLIHRESLGSLECRFCHMRFKWKCYLTRHIKKHYTKFECQRCSFVCAMESTAFLHEEAHSGVKIKCKYCVEEFRHRSTYYTHLRNHRSDYICSLCGASFVSEAGVHMHKRVKHVDVIEAEEVIEERKEVSTYCERCDMTFETRMAYEQHLLHSASHVDDKQASGEEQNNWKDLNQGKVKKPYRRRKRSPCLRISTEDGKDTSMYCERCDIRFETQKAYEQHFLHSALHPGGLETPDDQRFENELKLFKNGKKRGGIRRRKPTTCHHCSQQFETQSACFKHHLAHHPRTPFCPERHICEICGASLAPSSIASHLNSHTRAVLHTCDTCGKQFSTTMVLKRHQLTHTGQKPYPCAHCEKRFTQKNSMQLHFRTFHLKQPYPKRNRKKKVEGDDFRMEVESDGS